MEGWTPAAVYGCWKRPLESGRPEFMAREDGAYHVLEMPKKQRCGSMANLARGRARSHLLTDANGAGWREKKRELEVDEPEFVAAEESGAYAILEMTKKFKCGYMADPERSNSASLNALDSEDARLLALSFRETSTTNKYRQELQAMAAARRN